MKITQGYMPYLEYKTYYRIVGECTGNKKPLVLLHGGPGSTHNYFEVLDLCSPLIAKTMYDKIPNSEWELFEYSRHMPFVEENDKYIKILNKWMNKND